MMAFDAYKILDEREAGSMIDLIPDEHELIFRKPKSLYMRREMAR